MSVRRYAALTTVLTGGAIAAMPFYRAPLAPAAASVEISAVEASPEPADAAARPAPLPLPRIAVEVNDEEADEIGSPALESGRRQLPEWYQPTPILLASDEAPLPILSHMPTLRKAAPQRSAATIHEPDFTVPEAGPTLPAVGERLAPVVVKPPKRHRIADGDSLSNLALRYLGDERRADEILACNRDILVDRALLPVGKSILIPSQ